MKKTVLNFTLFILFVAASVNVVAQIDEIKNASSENASSSSDDSSSDDSDIWDDDDDDYEASGYSIDTLELSVDIKALFDVGYHKGVDRNYTYVDYLPGIRVSVCNFLMCDFRYNILTEYTDGNPNSFKSYEIVLAINPASSQNFDLNAGLTYYREIWDEEPQGFWGAYLGTKCVLNNNGDFIDADIRYTKDGDTGAYPFFETGLRFNKQFMDFEYFSGYVTLGATYQNYYQMHDIWAIRGGIIINWHTLLY